MKLFVKAVSFIGILASLGLSCLLSVTASAHDTPIAQLVISERQLGVYNVEWNYNSALNLPSPTAVFPANCEYHAPKLLCGETGLVGELSVLQLGEKYSAAVVQIQRLNIETSLRETESYTLTGANPSINLLPGGKMPLQQIVSSYIPLGFEHIMLGVDHLLFVLGLMLLVSKPWTLVKTITSFTAAHSITLAAVTLGWMGVAEQPVNALIALSIAILAVEVIKHRRGDPCLSARLPWLIAFGFGLLHGFGFAGALTKIGLPPESLPAALLFFNVGVELGQLSFVILVLLVYWCNRVLQVAIPSWFTPASIYGMGAVGSFWFLSRVALIVSN